MQEKSQELQKQMLNKQARPKFFSDELKNEIEAIGVALNYPNTKELDQPQKLALWFRYMKSNITTIEKCGFNGCEKSNRIVNDSKSNGFKVSVGCCIAHGVKKSMIEKYGVENAMELESIKTKIKKTNLKKYGFENAAQSKVVQDKMKATNLERYGVDNIFQDSNMAKLQMASDTSNRKIFSRKFYKEFKHFITVIFE